MNEFKKHKNKEYYRTKKGLITRIYNAQLFACKKRGYKNPTYSKIELFDYLMSLPKFYILYNNWKESDYKKSLSPSVDRIDDYKSYSFDNIELVTWKENLEKAYLFRKIGKNNKHNMAVIQLSKDEAFISSYHSASEAERQTNVNNGNIIQVCKGKRKTAGGFKWKYVSL